MELARNSEVWVVDLDHTLVNVDTGIEGFKLVAARKPWIAVQAVLAHLFLGRARFKQILCSQRLLDVRSLSYNHVLLEKIIMARRAGHRIVLATASHQIMADLVAEYLGVFDDVLGTIDHNLKGAAKARGIEKLIGPEIPYIYWGDSEADFEVWKHSFRIGVVNPSADMLERILKIRSQDLVDVVRNDYLTI